MRNQELPGEGHILLAISHRRNANAGQPNGDGGGQADHAYGHRHVAAPSPETIEQIRYWHRRRCFMMDQRMRMDLPLGALLRMSLGWSKALPKKERDQISKHAKALIVLGEAEAKGKPVKDEPAYVEWRDVISASIAARAPFESIEKRAKKEMERLAETLPVWKSFGENIKGFGSCSLAVIVGEAGDLSGYASHSKLWKRMGVAVMDGKRQGGLSKNASKGEWIAHGYNRQRRSRLFVIGKALIKFQGRYRDIYLARKNYERKRAEEAGLKIAPSAKIPEKRAAEFMSLGHIDKRAQRYMEKRLLRDLWRAWQA